jgi:EAL domain-containing protein (putative c-di-GMP-specific phosphodiesterase class I)/ActR/RegA family two-component response regulator
MLNRLAPKPDSVLIVDDSALQRAHTASLCRRAGIDLIYEAGNGIEALELLSMLVLTPGAMILDLEMPGMDGVELIQQLQQRNLLLPVIIVSGREQALIDSIATMTRSMGFHVPGALRKPLQAGGLERALREYGEALTYPVARVEPDLPSLGPIDLGQAIDRGEIIVHYQPKVDIRTGIIRGLEALARWTHPVHGMIPPNRFIPLAESNGLIRPLTLSVIPQVLARLAGWNARGLRWSVSINLSPSLLDDADLVPVIVEMVQKYGVAPAQIVFEITESSVASHLSVALGVLARLRLKGFGLSIDDYGTGFSSMLQLARIPFTELKIDRSFVHGAHQRKRSRVLLQSALDMARQLGLITVAEGIETIEDWLLLQSFDCCVGQGYLIARPMPAEDLPAWLHLHRERLCSLRQERRAPPARPYTFPPSGRPGDMPGLAVAHRPASSP